MHRLVLALGVLALAACSRGDAPRPVASPKPPERASSASVRSGMTVPEQRYMVKRGDSVYAIAKAHGLPVRAIIDANNLRPPYAVEPGTELRLPAARVHLVEKGETLSILARKYDLSLANLARLNKLNPPYTIYVGQPLLLPAAAGNEPRTFSIVATAPSAPPPALPQSQPAKPDITPPAAASPSAPPPAPAEPPAVEVGRGDAKTFLWPVAGPILSRYGPKEAGLHNDGINIAARPGTAVKAAADGTVAYAGNELKGYGNLVLVRHPGGWITAYAHNQELLVKRGDLVKQGQTIARVGATGSVRDPQLHFEIRRGSRAVDPLDHLPPRMASLIRSELGGEG